MKLERVFTSRTRSTREVRYYITSLTRRQAPARFLLKTIRGHWGAIENGLHRVRDTTFDEDRCTIFRGHAPQNLAALRNAALTWLRRIGAGKITTTVRSFARNSLRLFSRFGYRN